MDVVRQQLQLLVRQMCGGTEDVIKAPIFSPEYFDQHGNSS